MKCGGCVGHVKQLLEKHASVSGATVNLATETALVRVKLAAGADLSALAAELAKVRARVECSHFRSVLVCTQHGNATGGSVGWLHEAFTP